MSKTIVPQDGDPFRCRVDDAHPISSTVARSATRENVSVTEAIGDANLRRAKSSDGRKPSKTQGTASLADDAFATARSPDPRDQTDSAACLDSLVTGDSFDWLDNADTFDVLDHLRTEHISNLIRKLQTWSDSLDRREAELNARQAMIDHRERTVRIKLQSQQNDLLEQERVLKRRQQTIESHLRRMALANFSFE